MKKEIIVREYETDIHLEALYELLDYFYKPNCKKYPDDVKNKMNELIKTLDKYLYHNMDGYDIVDEEIYKKIKFFKQNF